MESTRILSDEHRVIEVMLNCLEKMCEQAEHNQRLDTNDASQAVDFIRNFADICHHGKEETILFTTLTDKGIPQEGGPVGVMLSEHETGRQFVKIMADNINKAGEGNQTALNQFVTAARNYILLLRAHIQKEDRILFPLADRTLSEEDNQAILKQYQEVEIDHMGEGTHEKYLALVQQLAQKYNVPMPDVNHHTCCHH